MLQLATFCGRKVSEVVQEQSSVVKFSDFLIEFFVETSLNADSLRSLIGEQLLYIKRADQHVQFHFTSDLCLSINLEDAPSNILLYGNKNEENFIKNGDEAVFENI